MQCRKVASASKAVTSFTLVWIKMLTKITAEFRLFVTSFTLVWIKMINFLCEEHKEDRHELHARVD